VSVKPAPASDSFQGLPTAIDLPKLTPGMTDPPAEALVSLVIGPCTPDATAQLKGGQSALRGGKATFELREGKDDQSLGKWDVVMTIAQAPLTIAQLSVQNKQLAFQWTADGAKHESSPYLGNCKLVLSAGTDQHEISLRKPMEGESLLVDFEKPGATVKWTVEHLPDPRKIVVEISRLGEAFPAHKFDPGPTMAGNSADTLVWTGADPENASLGIKFESSQTPKYVQIKATAQLKQGGSPKVLLPRTLKSIEKEIDQTRLGLVNQEKLLSTDPPGATNEQKALRKKTLDNVKKQQDELNAQGEQLNKLQQLLSELKDKSEIHFRVYYLADESQVDLVVTDAAPAKEKKAAPKPDAGKAKK
jgi:eukaryotic-like serine/threonine-protein kinase